MSHVNDSVLVLNKNWVAVNVAPARDIFGRLFNDHCRILHDMNPHKFNEWRELSYGYTGEDVVRTPKYQLRVPSVAILVLYDRLPKKEVRFVRESVYERDRFTCLYCGQRFEKHLLNLDHIVPREHGGETTWENIATSCVACNSFKSNRTPEQAGMKLISVPRKPSWRTLCNMRFSSVMKPDWGPFLNIASWPAVEVSGHKAAV